MKFRFGSIILSYPETYYNFIKECFLYDVYRTDLLKEGDIVVDLGAAVGEFTILASRKVGRNGLVIAVEPNPEDFKLLEKNAISNKCENIILVNKGVAAAPAKKEISFWGRNFIARLETLGDILLEQGVTNQVNFIKMDIEGYETEVIAKETKIIRKVDIISLELHNTKNEIDKILGAQGFHFEPVTARYCIKKLLKNTLFSHPRHVFKAVVVPTAKKPKLLHKMLLKNEIDVEPNDPKAQYLLTGTYIRNDSHRS